MQRCKYFRTYADIARRYGVGCILESATWRCPDWGTKLGYSTTALAELNRQAIALLQEVRDAYEPDATPMVISGCIGPRAMDVISATLMTEGDAERYHTMLGCNVS